MFGTRSKTQLPPMLLTKAASTRSAAQGKRTMKAGHNECYDFVVADDGDDDDNDDDVQRGS